MVNKDGWRGYNGIAEVTFDSYISHHHNQDFTGGALHIKKLDPVGASLKPPQHFKGMPKHTSLLLLTDPEFRVNNRYEDLTKMQPLLRTANSFTADSVDCSDILTSPSQWYGLRS
jgi:hypothetical protein